MLGMLKWGLIVSVFLNMISNLEPTVQLISPQIKDESYLHSPTIVLASKLTPAFDYVKQEFKDNLPGNK